MERKREMEGGGVERLKIGITEKEMVKKNESTGEEERKKEKKGIQKKMGDHGRDGGRW